MNVNFTFILQIVSFLILLGLLVKVLYKPLTKYLDERAQNIQRMVCGAQEAESKAKLYAEKTEEALAQAKTDALKIKEQAKKLSDEERRRIIDQAKGEARFLIDEAKEQLGQEKELVLKKIKSEIVSISADIATKIIGREIRPEDHRRLVDASLSEIEDEVFRS